MSVATEITRLQTAKANLKTSIEAKGVTVSSSALLDAYPALVDAIPTGGGTVEEKDVNFYDYDGTLVASYDASEVAGLTDLPNGPDHSTDEVPLTFDEWNWTLAEIKSYVTSYPGYMVNVGANYHTTDGKIHLFFQITGDYNENAVEFTINDTGTVDWGDDSAVESITSGTAVTHIYEDAGIYHCIITSTAKDLICGHNFDSKASYTSKVIRAYLPITMTSAQGYTVQFTKCVNLKHISIPKTLTMDSSSNFKCCRSLQCFVIPRGSFLTQGCFQDCTGLKYALLPGDNVSVTTDVFNNCFSLYRITTASSANSAYFGSTAFSFCYSLQKVVIPNGCTQIYSGVFTNCYSLEEIILPNTITTNLPSSEFYNCYCLKKVVLPSSITELAVSLFENCFSLQEITIPSGVTNIKANAFKNNYSLSTIILEPTSPPTLNATFNTNYLKKIYVPYSADHSILTTYQNASNWSDYASIMEELPE